MTVQDSGSWKRAASLHFLSPLYPLPQVLESQSLRAVLFPWKGLNHSVPALCMASQLPGSLLEPGNQREDVLKGYWSCLLPETLRGDSCDHLLGTAVTSRGTWEPSPRARAEGHP